MLRPLFSLKEPLIFLEVIHNFCDLVQYFSLLSLWLLCTSAASRVTSCMCVVHAISYPLYQWSLCVIVIEADCQSKICKHVKDKLDKLHWLKLFTRCVGQANCWHFCVAQTFDHSTKDDQTCR